MTSTPARGPQATSVLCLRPPLPVPEDHTESQGQSSDPPPSPGGRPGDGRRTAQSQGCEPRLPEARTRGWGGGCFSARAPLNTQGRGQKHEWGAGEPQARREGAGLTATVIMGQALALCLAEPLAQGRRRPQGPWGWCPPAPGPFPRDGGLF